MRLRQVAGDVAVAGHVGLAFAVPKCAVGFGAGIALGTAVPEPSLWEQTRKTTEGNSKGVAPFAGKQMPSNIRRQRRRLCGWGRRSRVSQAMKDASSDLPIASFSIGLKTQALSTCFGVQGQ